MTRGYPFKIKVLVKTRPNLRDNETTSMMGFQFLVDLFDSEKEMNHEEVYLEYPERWLNILEQRSLYEIIKIKCLHMKELSILTHSVFIIQSTSNECTLIDRTSDYPDHPYTAGMRYSPPLQETGGLQVFHMGKTVV